MLYSIYENSEWEIQSFELDNKRKFLKVVPGVFNEDPKENKNLKITCIYAR